MKVSIHVYVPSYCVGNRYFHNRYICLYAYHFQASQPPSEQVDATAHRHASTLRQSLNRDDAELHHNHTRAVFSWLHT